ncbi:MAG TPA: PAS domain S-box protein [Acidobacteriaceae bacterium]|nr:PAS domain S-box protein [Acidobacteriaceae bacterium]
MTDETAAEAKQLRTCINNLIGIVALPAIWAGSDAAEIVRTLLDTLVGMLRLDFVYMRLKHSTGELPLEVCRYSCTHSETGLPPKTMEFLNSWSGGHLGEWPRLVRDTLGDTDLSITPLPLGIKGEVGILVAGSQRVDFPEPTERLLLSVAANQVAVWLQGARLLNDQKRLTEELDQKVAQRTEELAAANRELQKEISKQQSISLENTRLYRNLEDRERKIRRLIDSNIIGIVIWDLDGRLLDANDAFLRMLRYDREDLQAGLRWFEMTPPEWQEVHARYEAEELKATGMMQVREKEYFRKDGSRVPVLIGAACFEDQPNQGVAYILDLSEQKRVEEALRQSESYLAQAQELAHIGSWAWAIPRLHGLHASEEWYRIWGFDPRDGIPAWEERLQRIHHDDRTQYQAAINRAVAEKSDYDVQFRILRPHSPVKYIHSIGHPVLDSSGELAQFVGVTIDITEQTIAEEALRSSQTYLMEAQRLTHTGSCAIDGSRQIQYWSDQMFQIFGFDPEQGLPTFDQWAQRIHPEDRDKFRVAGDKTFLEKVHCDTEFRIVRPDGTIKHIHGIGHPVLSPSGELVQVVGTMVDITERKRSEQERERLREVHRVVVETASDAVISADERGVIQLANPATMRVFGYDPKELIGKSLTVLMPEAMRDLHEKGFGRYLATGQRHMNWQGTELIGLRKDGQQFPVEVSFGELTTNGHRVFTGFIRDITERKQAEEGRERLRQMQADLAHITRVSTVGELTASLAHEIKQPIGAAVTNAEACIRLLSRDQPDLPEAREAALEMIRDARRAADIIERVRSLYQKGSSQLERVDVNQLIEDMANMMTAEANRQSVKIGTDLANGLPIVNADRVQLQQAFMNLMLNGIEAMRGTTGELSIKSQLREDGQVLISISDTGIGLPPGKINQIFDAFFTTKPQGTGLGLMITRSIVESHGGRIWATANSGPGATFQFTLPIMEGGGR